MDPISELKQLEQFLNYQAKRQKDGKEAQQNWAKQLDSFKECAEKLGKVFSGSVQHSLDFREELVRESGRNEIEVVVGLFQPNGDEARATFSCKEGLVFETRQTSNPDMEKTIAHGDARRFGTEHFEHAVVRFLQWATVGAGRGKAGFCFNEVSPDRRTS